MLSEKDIKCINQIRLELAELLAKVPDYNTDFNLLRWLQGYEYRLDVIIPLLANHLRCHLAWNLDEILLEKPNEICSQYYPGGLHTTPVRKGSNSYLIIETLGKLDVEGMFASVPFLTVLRNRVASAERSQKLFVAKEALTGQQANAIFLLDLEGLQIDLKLLISLASGPYASLCAFFNQHYVEHVKNILVINAPSVFNQIWYVLKPLVAQKTREKLHILGADWREELLKYVDADQLPVHWGGQMVDKYNDPMCSSIFIVPQGKIPTDLYWKPSVEDEKLMKNMKELRVAAGDTEFLTIKVESDNLQLNWMFSCSGTFSFGIFLAENTEDSDTNRMEMVFPHLINLAGPHRIPEKGHIKCRKKGFYKVLFANTAAWFYSLHVKCYYHLSVTNTD